MQQTQALLAVVPQLKAGDASFALSLCAQATRKPLSSKQLYWVGELIRRATQPATPVATTDIGSGIEGVVTLLDKAKEHLKYPKLLVRAAGQDIRLSVAGAQARCPGTINVCSVDSSYGDREWYGRVTREGVFEPRRSAPIETQAAIAAALKALAADPAGVAAAYGKLTGVCCFCASRLTDERSTAVGYGKTCAKHYGLAWGTK